MLLIGGINWSNNNDAPPTSGTCRLRVDATPSTSVVFGENTFTHTFSPARWGSSTVSTVTGVLTAGNHTVVLECNETETDMFIEQSTLSAVVLGPG